MGNARVALEFAVAMFALALIAILVLASIGSDVQFAMAVATISTGSIIALIKYTIGNKDE